MFDPPAFVPLDVTLVVGDEVVVLAVDCSVVAAAKIKDKKKQQMF